VGGVLVREVAGEQLVGVQAELEAVVVVDRVAAALRVKVAVAVEVDELLAVAEDADLGPAVDGEAGHEVAAGLAVAAGEGRLVERLAGVALAVEVVARRVD